MRRIKWLILTGLTLVILSATAASAQQLGITGGLNIASLTGHPYSSPRDGLIIGGFARYDLAAGLSLEPEVLFSMKGASGSVNTLGPLPVSVPQTSTLTMDYIEIPVLLRMNLFTLPILPAGFDVFAGPDFAFNVYSESKSNVYYPAGMQVVTTNESGDTRSFDFNIAVGGGPHIDLGPTSLGVEVRYTFGTGRAFRSAGGNWNNNVWSIMASAGF